VNTRTNEPRIELRNVKYAAFASEETSCFRATVVVDGKPFCVASNDGHGGPDFFEPIAKITRAKLDDEIFEIAKRINPNAVRTWQEARGPDAEVVDEFEDDREWFKHHKKITADSVFSGAVGFALSRSLMERDLRRAMKRKVLFTDASGKIFEVKKPKGEFDRLAFEDAIAVRRRTQGKPVVAFLERLPIERAVEVWERSAS